MVRNTSSAPSRDDDSRSTPCPTSITSDCIRNYLPKISSFITSVREDLWTLNNYIHSNPELAFEEHKAHAALTTFLQSRPGWRVTPSAYNMATAWTAVYTSPNSQPGPTVSFNVEMDALPHLGHACGHNLIATVSLAAALSTAALLSTHSLPGRIILLGTPGEEGSVGGKKLLLRAGAYDGVDITLISHPSILHNSTLVRTTAFAGMKVQYFGKEAHGAREPWEGVNALDALVLGYVSVGALRQQLQRTDVVGMRIVDGGRRANLVHGYASGEGVVRARSSGRLELVMGKVRRCFEAGAEATGAKCELEVVDGYKDHVPNRVLGRVCTRHWNETDEGEEPLVPKPVEEGYVYVQASTDQGDLSYALPSLNVSFAIPPAGDGGQPHTPDFEMASGTVGAFERALRVAKAMAATALDVLGTPGQLEQVKASWRADMAAATDGKLD